MTDINLKMNEAFQTMKDNTEVNDKENQLRVAKLQMPANVVDFLLDHYHFFDLVELNQMSLYILMTMGRMEMDGFKFIAYRQNDNKPESYHLDVHDLIDRYRIQMAESINKEKQEVVNEDNQV